MADPQKLYRQLLDSLPELARVMAYDFERFETCRRDNLVDYARTLWKLAEILFTMPSETQEEAIGVIRDYMDSRQREYGQWHSADWLAYMLGQAVEKAKKRQRRKPAKDELPF